MTFVTSLYESRKVARKKLVANNNNNEKLLKSLGDALSNYNKTSYFSPIRIVGLIFHRKTPNLSNSVSHVCDQMLRQFLGYQSAAAAAVTAGVLLSVYRERMRASG